MPIASLVCLVTITAGLASAQNPYWQSGYAPARTRPVVSPYLSLTNGGNPALNYFNGVRPQQAFNNQINRLQQSVAANQQALTGLQAASPLGPTGHPVEFLSYQQYFNTFGGGAGSRSSGGRGASTMGAGTSMGASSASAGSSRTGSRIR